MPAHSRPKDGVLSHAYVAGIHVFAGRQCRKAWVAGTSPAMTTTWPRIALPGRPPPCQRCMAVRCHPRPRRLWLRAN